MKNSIKYISILTVIFVVCTIIYVNLDKTPIIHSPTPRSESSWVGDVMPFYDNNKWNIFYLEDHRDGEIGFHPFSLFSTNNFYEYKDYGVVIPYVNEEFSQERALGTGSIIKDKDNTYHAFYTAHNGALEPKEAIMHASSKNLKKWTKHEEEMFFGADHYDNNDFRDPFVFYNDEEETYWMLITTRKNNQGVIARYTSDDLVNWEDQGVFFENDMGSDGNLECPSLIEYNGKWYLAFSDQWPDRVTHYRIADSPNGPFKKPDTFDHFDSNAYYAGQLQKDDQGNLYIFAWIPTKEAHDDNKPYNWAGNLAIHQLKQENDGTLKAEIPTSIESHLIEYKAPQIISEDSTSIKLDINDKSGLLNLDIDNSDSERIVFTFNAHETLDSGLHVIIQNNEIAYYNDTLKYVENSNPLSKMKINQDMKKLNLKLMIHEDIFIFYINDEQAFSTRIIKGEDSPIEITKSENTTITINE